MELEDEIESHGGLSENNESRPAPLIDQNNLFSEQLKTVVRRELIFSTFKSSKQMFYGISVKRP